ncbi:M16 family metallopeptidase [Gracilimonas mengyeensis]|uniref:Predicted Zn-dependent peptidase n=1 Tax=Gracilimonas mengyeensis TaxID=1302730 RepID=A0A521ARG1_9BACT|nr:pitrilysin family protein [Gracilimonas mengyeensis]SMO37408.1 Predicted Zn-dependent peptidase [Gracilimonas mengyeensis]
MQDFKEIDFVNKSTLPNGIRIVTEHIDSVKSVSVGIWVKTGGRHERAKQAGITHFLEHMLFKGTDKRSSYDIALSMESVGGYLNAFTSSEYTCYYARCVNTQLHRALDVLSDMVLNPSFPEEEVQKEKKVVIEEMKMYRDSPDDYLFEEFNSKIFDGHELGRPVLGYEDTVSDFSRQDLYDYMSDRYYPGNLLISVAGNVDHENVVKEVKDYFEKLEAKNPKEDEQPLPAFKKEDLKLTKAIEQTHYIYGRRGLNFDHDDKYRLLLANTVLGGGMSSRLHQNVREKYGYCYSIQTFNQSYTDTGMWGVYVGTDKEYVDHVRELIKKELKQMQEEPVPKKELDEAKAQLKGKLLLSQESTSNRMMRLAKSELYFGRFVTLDELVENIDSVSAEDIQNFAKEFFNDEDFMEAILLPEE